ncbi:helix-turn-helix domain-containing protein [Paenibacillus sp. TRM 82003]|nr:helix-turn-helix domain-containing protein [Paenibacillus sp. TRM 82003]
MELETLRTKLESILQKKVVVDAGGVPEPNGTAFDLGKDRLIVYGIMTETERELVKLLCEDGRSERRGRYGGNDDERLSQMLSDWLMEQLEAGDVEAELPEPLNLWPALNGAKVPLLLYGEYPERLQRTSYAELKKLLRSFFEGEIVLVPLHNKQWLILGDESLLTEQRDEEDESIEDALSALASGLQDMAASEWVGECHVATTHPFSPGTSLVQTVASLRETIELGRTYRLTSYIHLPWELRLETLLDTVPRRAKHRFLEGVLRRAEPSFEPEMLQTLDAFFMENCNVSDTAKRLYIHRNTLLYRLDKFKQETGMDVRDFDHAVLVRLALLLYKVTKRK